MSDGVLVWEKSSSLFYALEVVSVFENRAMPHDAGVLLLELRQVFWSIDALQNDCGYVHLRCCDVQFFVIEEEIYDEVTRCRDCRE